MTRARKARIHEARNGLCGECGFPVEMYGSEVRYDHRIPLWLSGDDSDENIWPCHKSCDAKKTPADLTTIAKTKRIILKNTEPHKPSRIKSRGFDKSKTRTFSGKIIPRKR